ncbi:MAG: SDR family NAD(P)-dependent oxidoreductase [Cytophagales bacterium]|nr:MAG: NAD(P)-dependent oxidoreductase [Rhodothermaeota bacterium MED-G16]
MDQNNNKKIVFITGATSGIGQATAKLLSNNYDLILCGRREERLIELRDSLSKITNVIILSFDVRNKDEVSEKINSLNEKWKNIDFLINNAGNAHGMDYIFDGNSDDWDKMIDINVKGLLYVSKEILKIMVFNKRGHVINIGSIAGKEVYPKGNIYCASKFAVDAISQSMRIDLNHKNIKVSQVNPGLVNTEFSKVRFKNDLVKAENVYKGMDPLIADDVADVISFIMNRSDNVNISDITILPKSQASSTVVKRD